MKHDIERDLEETQARMDFEGAAEAFAAMQQAAGGTSETVHFRIGDENRRYGRVRLREGGLSIATSPRSTASDALRLLREWTSSLGIAVPRELRIVTTGASVAEARFDLAHAALRTGAEGVELRIKESCKDRRNAKDLLARVAAIVRTIEWMQDEKSDGFDLALRAMAPSRRIEAEADAARTIEESFARMRELCDRALEELLVQDEVVRHAAARAAEEGPLKTEQWVDLIMDGQGRAAGILSELDDCATVLKHKLAAHDEKEAREPSQTKRAPIVTIRDLHKRRHDGPDRAMAGKLRPERMDEVVGQEDAVAQIRANLRSPLRRHMLFLGGSGVGKTTVARLCFEELRGSGSGFKADAPCIEYDCAASHHDEYNRISSLIGYAEDPSYRGVSDECTKRGVPEIRIGAISQAHGGMLFLDEIGTLPRWVSQTLLKTLEDGKVRMIANRTAKMEERMTDIEREFFDEGLPANFLMIGATTADAAELEPALLWRCMVVRFRSLSESEIAQTLRGTMARIGIDAEGYVIETIARTADNPRAAAGTLIDAYGFRLMEGEGRIETEHLIRARRAQLGERTGFRR